MLRSGPAHSGCGPSGQTVPLSGSEPTWESGCGSEPSHWGTGGKFRLHGWLWGVTHGWRWASSGQSQGQRGGS